MAPTTHNLTVHVDPDDTGTWVAGLIAAVADVRRQQGPEAARAVLKALRDEADHVERQLDVGLY